MLTANSTNLFILFWGGSQVLSGYFIKRNLVNLSFQVLKYGTLKKTVYILFDWHHYVETLVKKSFLK